MHEDASGDIDWSYGASRLVSRQLQASDEQAVEHLATKTSGGASFSRAFRLALARHDDAERPWLADTMALENPAGGLLCAGLHVQGADVLHEHRIELAVALDPPIAETALAPLFLEALERAARIRWGADRRLRRDGDVVADVPAWLRLTVIDDPALGAVAEARGFELAHAEDDMVRPRRPASSDDVRADALAGVLAAWSDETATHFHRAYQAAFGDRPGFPGWSEARWRRFATGYDAFRPELSHVLLGSDAPLAFRIVAIEEEAAGPVAHVVQLGVVPAARRSGTGKALLADLDARLPDAVRTIELSVNANNPAARALFARDGFEVVCRRSVYRKALEG